MGTGDVAHRLAAHLGLLRREVVQAQGDALGGAPVVHEHQRRAVLADETQEFGVDGRPDRAPGRLPTLHAVELDRRVGLDHRLDRHVDTKVERLAYTRVHDRTLPPWTDEEARHLVERPLRGRKSDALHIVTGLPGEAFQRQREVSAALCLRHRVDLIDDDPLHTGEELPCLRGQHEVEGLGRRDQDVGRCAQHHAPLPLRRVAGAHRHAHVGADAAQRRLEVALDVVAERLERRDVDETRRPLAWTGRRRLGDEAVERPQEGGERLARARRRGDERVSPRGDRRPGLRLGRRRLGEGTREPLAHLRCERRKGGVRDARGEDVGRAVVGPGHAGVSPSRGLMLLC